MKKILILLLFPVFQEANAQVSFSYAPNVPVGTNPVHMIADDFNSDGKTDLATANMNAGSISVFMGDGLGNFSAGTSYTSIADPVYIISADFNTDGKVDIAVQSGVENYVSVFLGNGLGQFSAATNYFIGFVLGSNSIACNDFNNDGKLDLIINNSASTNLSVLNGDGFGGFSVDTLISYLGSGRIVSGNFNNDGNIDIVTSTDFGFWIDIALGNGLGSFAAPVMYSILPGEEPWGLVSSDFNSDGDLDIVTANRMTNTVSILLGNGLGAFSTATVFNVGGLAPYDLSYGDYNSDGDQDIAIVNYDSDSISVLLGNGAGMFSAPFNFPVNDKPMSIVSADFNGDGALDLAVANRGSQNLSILLNSTVNVPNLIINYFSNEIVLYPNPTSGLMHIKHDEKLSDLQIFDMVGRLIINQKCNGETETKIDMSNLPNGVYHVKAAGYNSIKVVKNNWQF